jgi:O-antigen ligase
MNALLGIGLWFLLWSGYNTDIGRMMNPFFPTDKMDLIHGIRSLGPALAVWFALMIIMARAKRLFAWVIGPLGLMLLYAIVGLISSATLSNNPLLAVYFGVNYLAIVLVLLAIVLVNDPLPDLFNVLKFTWIVGTILTLSLLGAIPLLGSQVVIPTDATPLGMRVYGGMDTVMGMASTRNTGFARYAAVSALAALPGLMKKGNHLVVRIIWGILLAASLYALLIANGRTETAAFLASAFLLLGAEKSKRTLYILAGIAAAILAGLRGFYSNFYLYLTRGGRLDLTLTGRTTIWEAGWHLLWKSPWVGLGFQADRFFMWGWHMHNAFLHCLVQSGFLGGMALIIAIGITWFYTIQYFFTHQPSDKSLIPPEIPAILLFTTISSVTESTFAYYSAAWLLSAPIVAYVMALHEHMRRVSLKAAQDQILRVRLARRKPRVLESPPEVPPSSPDNGIPG